MLEAEDLKDGGYDLGGVAACCEYAMHGLTGMKSKEAQVVRNYLENLRDDCEGYDEDN